MRWSEALRQKACRIRLSTTEPLSRDYRLVYRKGASAFRAHSAQVSQAARSRRLHRCASAPERRSHVRRAGHSTVDPAVSKASPLELAGAANDFRYDIAVR